ncbi:APH(3') family aminoglycoside O-phosphotransferase [Kineosporia babensis]|uniref:Aminoglycoside 3'-phosphotransferase n=1 Tax=Kineosporia babensis TaxID=499548 RepID=A0A9X1T0T8_9ACTN|nr:APH(3') family aminoglycoside O-phosphotransferase [Kineosporia babensis]MCD5313108.1 aminoglycoside 3'-phosphotransferase [Kineosporia babensis]
MNLPEPLAALIHGYRWERDTIGKSGSTVHRLHGDHQDLFLKYAKGVAADEVTDELARLNWLRPSGLPVPEVVQFVRSGEEAWLLTTALPGRTADQELQAAKAPDAVVDALADFLRRLHRLDTETCPFNAGHPFRLRQARANIDAGRVDLSDFDDERQGWSAEQVWQELTGLLPLTTEPVVTHGDFSLKNLLIEDGVVTGVLDVGKLGVADRYQDLAIAGNALGEFGPQARTRFLERYGIATPDQTRMAFHGLLDELF